MHQNALASLLLGAGAGLVAAHPAPSWWKESKHHHGGFPSGPSASTSTAATSSYSSYSLASGSSYSSYSLASGSGVASPTLRGYAASSASGVAYSTGTGVYSYSASSVVSVAASTASAVAVASSTAVVSASSSNSTAAGATEGEVASVTASSSCTFTDLASAVAGKADCTDIVLSGIVVTAGETLDMTDLTDGTTVTFEGTTTFGYSEWDGPLISFSGTDITIQGADGHLINMGGEQWWDGEGSNGGVTKPKGFYAHDLTDSTITGLNIKNTPIQCFSINGASNLKVIDVTIDDSDGDVTDGGHNTDAFDVGSSTGVYISGAVVKNQDDCLAINSGTDISFTGGSCSGGHGLSIGSVGGRDDNIVENIYIADSTISNSENGVRIKTISGDTGTVKNVTYTGITLSNITDYGIVIEQDYENGSPTGTPTDGVPITDLTLSDITGSVASDAATYYILCASCSDWTVSGVDLTGGSASTDCEGTPTGVSLC
ncbi:Polygalacturonase 1 [Oleoguttula mirabilis]|uniref:endo-polygalacturonase n=1 Tax=Oleoguttula mirabilis TaxID=1507867 RepID=A0AAV9J7L3_9PEZI|nr:Polygalacturonase 1 [Oleoguttula mirabilis]